MSEGRYEATLMGADKREAGEIFATLHAPTLYTLMHKVRVSNRYWQSQTDVDLDRYWLIWDNTGKDGCPEPAVIERVGVWL